MRYFDLLYGKDKETFEMQVLRIETAFDLEIKEVENLCKALLWATAKKEWSADRGAF